MKRSIYGQEIKNEITAADNSTIHKKAIDFSSVDINGKLLRLSDFKGRYVLLDFWASWCIPCRQSTPYLKKLHNKYRKAGLDVIAIADDDNNHDKWRNAINVDKTELWYNILDGKIFANNSIDGSKSISKKYAINILPTRILIDKDGIITGRYSGTESAVELDKKLASIFNHHSN
ncbi:MAG TPA: TlpA disulfide reductase family protein [Mucilaginibacter sp.]|nr:TlpA disulfide reductase family protein [Mucilaginibacter sp.]